MKTFRIICFLSCLLLAGAAFPVTLSMGNEVASPNSSDANIGPTRTVIDLVHPASATGSVTSVKFYWSSSSCANAVKVKFFRRLGNTLTMVAERGPFTPTTNTFTVAMSPAVQVQQGDLIGLARVAACGNAGQLSGAFPSEGFVGYASDVTGSVALSDGEKQGGVLAVSGTGTASEYLAFVIPVVGSAPGAFGSYFRTEMQFFNPQSSGSITMKLVFHQMNSAGSSADTTRLVILDPREVFATSDVVSAMGRSGLGSLDVILPAGSALPLMLARVYNDAGSSGTSSLTEIPVEADLGVGIGRPVLSRGVTGFLVTPHDPARTRFNVGVRTFHSGAVIAVRLRDSEGNLLQTIYHYYPANWFVQMDAAAFAGTTIGADQSMEISVSSGSAVVYGSTTDNTTNDPAIQFATGVFAIA